MPASRIARNCACHTAGSRRMLRNPGLPHGPKSRCRDNRRSRARVPLMPRRSARPRPSGSASPGPARTIAALVARSPCAGSRGGSTATRDRSSPAGNAPSAARSSSADRRTPAKIAENVCHCCGHSSPRYRTTGGARRGRSGRSCRRCSRRPPARARRSPPPSARATPAAGSRARRATAEQLAARRAAL